MALSLDQFIQRMADSGLITADEVTAFVDALPQKKQPADAEALAKQLVAAKRLTPFQAQQIWKGKGKSLTLGDYVISDKIGAGGMGMVFKAHHRLMKREVALKVLPPAVTKDQMAIQRFLREVEAAAKLTHPNIVAANDARENNGAYYLIMEYVEGRDLSETVKKQGPATVAQAVDFVLQAARGLAFAHEQGVIHRDIKPANLLLDKSGVVKILDMGLARIEDDSIDAATQAGLTGTGTIMGTIDYMAPEQADDSKRAGPQADIYSLGATLYFLLTAQPMVAGDTLGKKLRVLLTGKGLPDSITALRTEASAEVDAIFRKMTAYKMADRYETMTAVIADLEALQAGDVPSSASTPGIQPVAAARSDDSAMQSFLHKLDDGTAITEQTVALPPKTEVGAETMTSAVGEATRSALKPTVAFTVIDALPKNKKLLIGGAVMGVLLLGAIIWSVSGGRNELPAPKAIAAKNGDAGQDETTKTISTPRGTADSPSSDKVPPPAVAPFDEAQAKAHQKAWASYLGEPVETTNSIGMKFVVIPPGEFTMGELDNTAQVTLTKPFRIGVHEVTQGQWKAVIEKERPWSDQAARGADGTRAREGVNYAASYISWILANEFCESLTKRERTAGRITADQEYRLPTEAEWEYACRAGMTTAYSFGDDESRLGEYAWYKGNVDAGESYAHEVGKKLPNAWGLYDVDGNVREFCLGVPVPSTEGSEPGRTADPQSTLRGGSFSGSTKDCRPTKRSTVWPSRQNVDMGIRVVLTTNPPKRETSQAPATDTDRAVAEWIIELGGGITLDASKNPSYFKWLSNVDELPAGNLRVEGVRLLIRDRKLEPHTLIEELKKLKHLHYLQIQAGGWNGACLEDIVRLPALTGLQLSRFSLTDADLERHLKNMPNLEHLGLSSQDITDKGMVHLRNLKNLSSLNLFASRGVGDDGLKVIGELKTLTHLNLGGTQVTDAGLIHLESLQNLTYIFLKGTKTTPEGFARLKQALPKCGLGT